MIEWIHIIVDEMTKGNFSFAILIVGILQLIAMYKNNRGKQESERSENSLESTKTLHTETNSKRLDRDAETIS